MTKRKRKYHDARHRLHTPLHALSRFSQKMFARLQWAGEERGVVGADDIVATVNIPEFELAHSHGHDGLELHIGELLADAPMSSGTEGQVRGTSSLAHQTVAVVDLLFFLRFVLDDGWGQGRVLFPSVGVPQIRLREVVRVLARNTRCGEEGVGGGNDILGTRNGHGLLDGAQDGMDAERGGGGSP